TTAVEAQPVPVDLIADEPIDAFSASDDCEGFAEEIESIRSSPVCKLKLADKDVAPLSYGQPGREYPETPFINRFLTDAAEHILDTLGWCLKRDNSCADIFVRQVVELPTVIDFLDLAFQRAAIVLPELLGDQPALEAAEAQPSNGHACARIPRLYATQSFVYACDIADMLAYDHGSQRFSASRLAAVSFYFVAAHNGFDDSMFEACTGYTVLDIKPVVARTIALLVSIYGRPGLSMGDVLCCSEKARYKHRRGKVEPEQQWLLQPFHAHIKHKFEHAHCGVH
ncbi:hypothetical protein LPJ57_009228, partial [Coemansia sp. RSA 486]